MANENAINIPSRIVFFREFGFFVASNKKTIASINPKYAAKVRCPLILESKLSKIIIPISFKIRKWI